MWTRLWQWLDHWFFGTPAHGTDPLAVALRILRYPYAVLRDLSRGDINLRAMGLVYTTLLTTVPLLAFSFAILKGFGAHRDLEPIIYEFFRPIGSSATELTAKVMQFADNVSSSLLGSIGFALLLWTLISTIQKVEDSFNYLWRVELPRSFARRIAEYVALLILGPVLLVAFIGLTHAAMNSAPMQALSTLPFADRITALALELSPYLMVTTLFTFLYMFVPNTRVRFMPALVGGLAAGVLWAAVGKIFTALVVYSTRLTIVYAGFALIVAALIWTYFGWLILLIGARLSFYVQNPAYLRLGLEDLKLSGVELENLALKVMYLVGKAHGAGTTRWSSDSLAVELALPGIAISEVVGTLERASLLVATEDDRLMPGRDIGHIPLEEILDVVRNEQRGHLLPRDVRVPAVDRLTGNIREALRNCCANRTLRDLIDEPV